MPALDAVQTAYAEDGVVVVGVDVGERPRVVADFLERTPVDYPIWVGASDGRPADDTNHLLRRFGGVGLPTTVFIDREGIVRKIRVGELNRAVVEREIEALLR